MAEFSFNGHTKVKTFKAKFRETFGATLRVYKDVACQEGFADDEATLAAIRTAGAKGGELTVRSHMQIGNFEKKVAKLFGIGIQIANAEDTELVDDSITLSEVGSIPTKTSENSSKKNHVRIEIELPEYEYVALNQDECPIGDTFAFNDACEGFNSIRIYVDGQLLETEDDEIELKSKYSDYQSHKLNWDVDEIIYSVGYYENTVSRVWEFEVENFDLEKLTEKWTCYDVSYADYEAENHHLTLMYNGQELEEDLEGYGSENDGYEQIWSMDDDEDECYCDDEDMDDDSDEDVEADDCNVEITPDTIIDDIYIKFTLKYPHLHLRFLSEPGVMESLVNSSLTIEEVRIVLNSQCTTNQGTVSLAGNRTISDLCAELRSYGVGSVWVCCHYGEDMEPEPHGEDRTLSYAESQSLEDAAYMIAGMRKITPEGTIIEEKPVEFSMSLSEKFGILATTLAGMDNNLQKGEVDIALIIARQCDQLNIDEVRTAIFKELKGIQEYESQSKIVKSIQGDDRELIFQYLVLLAISDLTLSQGELQLLGGIADVWGWDWDDCSNMINCIIENFQNDNPGKIVKIEE